MSKAFSARHSPFSGARMRGLDLRAVDRLGVKRLATDSRRVKRGDIVLIAGKGHETYQETKGVRRPFSDLEAARAELRRWSAAA